MRELGGQVDEVSASCSLKRSRRDWGIWMMKGFGGGEVFGCLFGGNGNGAV